MANDYTRVEDDSPERCQGMFKKSQCNMRKAKGSNYCIIHGGNIQHEIEKKNDKMYRLAKWRDRMSNFAEDTNIKSLREEIGILRILMEETVNMCEDSQSLLMYSSKISDLAMKLEKLVSSCHRLEASTGMLLDKAAAIQIASTIVKIISAHITDDDIIDSISNEIISAIINVKAEIKNEKN